MHSTTVRTRGALVTALTVAALAAVTVAAPVNYNESIGGDLPFSGTPLPTFTLDNGSNLVSGTVSRTVVNPNMTTSDFDSFAFVVPAGLSVVGGSIVLNETDGGSTLVSETWRLFVGSANSPGGTLVNAFVVPTSTPVTLPALAAGTYNFTNSTMTTTPGATPFTANYTFTLVVAPVPEPAALGLCAVAALGLRRRSARAR